MNYRQYHNFHDRNGRNIYGYGHTQLSREDKRGTLRALFWLAVMAVSSVLAIAAFGGA